MKNFFTLFLIICISAISTYAASYYTYTTGTGNPGTLNTESDNNTVGWTMITFGGSGSGGTSTNVWSDVVLLPGGFNFAYMSSTRSQFQVSKNGVITFWASGYTPNNTLASVPGDNTATPPTAPRNMVAVFWDKFATTPPLGSDDQVYYKVFGSAPNRQVWIKWYSFTMNTASSTYFACVLEESTSKIYMVDYKCSTGGNLLTCSTGIWDYTWGDMVTASPNITLGSGTTAYTDNFYYAFDPLPPAAPLAPTISVNVAPDDCSPILNQPFNNNPIITYYWQGTTCGTLMTNSNPTYTPTADGTYYLRAYNSATGKWSATCSSADIVDYKPRAPQPTFSVSTNTCGDKYLSITSDVSGTFDYYGDTWYEQAAWQGTTCGQDVLLDATADDYVVSSSGTYFLRSYWVFHDMDDIYNCWSSCASAAVIVNPYPTTPPIPDVSTNTCGDKIITRATPPGGITYYWQTTAGGTSTSNSSLTYTATTSGTYYLRALTTAGCWSTAVSVTVTVNPIPADPAIPTVSANVCGDKTITRANPPVNTTFYWQTSASGVAVTNSVSSFTTSASGSFYLRARTTAGCWSNNSSSVSVTVYSIPAQPTLPTLSSNKCGTRTLTHDVPAGGITYFWQAASDGMNTANSATDLVVSTTGDYYLRSRSIDGCWSTNSVSKFVQINDNPATPPVPTSDASSCNKATIRHAKAPAKQIYYWQSGANTQETLDSSSAKEVISSGLYYLRAVSDSSCWSSSVSLGVNVYAIPAIPATPTLGANICGDRTLTRDNPPFNVTYYWQDSATGTKITDIAKNKVAPQTGTYYLRAQSTDGGCWSAGASSIYVYVMKPYDKEHICLVTIDSATMKNRIIWYRTAGKKTVSYKIYKFVTPNFTEIGTRPYDSLSVFIDKVSDPNAEPYRYAISVVDSCGNESALSPAHQTMKLWSSVSTEKNAANINWYRYIDEGGEFVPDSFYIYKGKTKSQMELIAAQPATIKEIQIFTDYNFKGPVAYYQVGVKKTVPCSPAVLKAESGPYTQSLSNIAEYKVTGLATYQEIPASLYPNPFNDKTTLEFYLDESSNVTIEVSNALGQKTALFEYKSLSAGSQTIILNAEDMHISDGICYLKIIATDKTSIIKAMFIK